MDPLFTSVHLGAKTYLSSFLIASLQIWSLFKQALHFISPESQTNFNVWFWCLQLSYI